jgi:hypothetical protein
MNNHDITSSTNSEHVSVANLYLKVPGSSVCCGTIYSTEVLYGFPQFTAEIIYIIARGLRLMGCVYRIYYQCENWCDLSHSLDMHLTLPISEYQCLEDSGGIVGRHRPLGEICLLHFQGDRITSVSMTKHCSWASNSKCHDCST